METLIGKAAEQEKQLKDINQKAAELLAQQSQLAQNLLEQQNQLQIAQQPVSQISVTNPQGVNENIEETLSEMGSDMENLDEDKMVDDVMSWIEKS